MLVYEKIERGSFVLDLGCAGGYFGKRLKEKKCHVWGIDSDKEAIKEAKKYCEKTFIFDLDKIKRFPFRKRFDYVLILDVLEHLRNPEVILFLIKPHLKKKAKVIISVPNVAFVSVRLSLLFGNFNYRKFGILDETHLHFYTKVTFQKFLEKNGFKIEEMDFSSGFSQIPKMGKYLNYIPKYWQYKITHFWNTLLAYQFIAICTKIR